MGLLPCAAWMMLHLMAQDGAGWRQYGGPTGDFKTPAPPGAKESIPGWKRPFGQGTSGIVWDGDTLFTHYAEIDAGKKSAKEIAIALDPQTGKTLWESQPVLVTMLKGQQRFGSDPMRPQATPAVSDTSVFTLGFTGLLHAWDKRTGKMLWKSDLVADLGATPVQFGFAASPILLEGKLVVAAGGRHALIAFDPLSGKPIWKSDPAEPGYSTPVPMVLEGKKTFVLLTRDSCLGVDASNGQTLWNYDLPKKGLTNVPTPIPLGENRLLVSGQGLDGTRLMRLEREPSKITVKEMWHQPKAQFFYSNWVVDQDTVWGFPGNAGKRFSGLRLKDGVIVGQKPGQTDANLLLLGDDFVIIRGDGLLSVGKCGQEGFKSVAATRASQDRCWVAPLPIGRSVILRTESELIRVPLDSLDKDLKPPADPGVTPLEEAFSPPKKK